MVARVAAQALTANLEPLCDVIENRSTAQRRVDLRLTPAITAHETTRLTHGFGRAKVDTEVDSPIERGAKPCRT